MAWDKCYSDFGRLEIVNDTAVMVYSSEDSYKMIYVDAPILDVSWTRLREDFCKGTRIRQVRVVCANKSKQDERIRYYMDTVRYEGANPLRRIEYCVTGSQKSLDEFSKFMVPIIKKK